MVEDRDAFAVRCSARQRERQLGTGYGFGIFVDGDFAGEINLTAVQRGPFQSAYVGYWIDEKHAGNGYMPEALVVLAQFAFDELHLHRIQISIIPRNSASRRVVEKLGIRDEGVAARYLEINGVWEDHIRYAITAEEWDDRRDALLARLAPDNLARDDGGASVPRGRSHSATGRRRRGASLRWHECPSCPPGRCPTT